MRWCVGLAGCLVMAACVQAGAQTRGTVNLHVKERTGIRRVTYPVNARIPFPRGAWSDAERVRLMLRQAEVPAQYAVESTWPDGSIQWLAVDFNVSIGPDEEAGYQLAYGEGVRPEITPTGLTMTESADAIQVGNLRFSRTAAPLLLSVKSRQEAIAPDGRNGFAITDAAGAVHDATGVDGVKVEVIKRGPLYVVLRYSGQMPVGSVGSDDRVAVSITIEMPNSKSWWKATATVEDPGSRVREISFHTPFALGAFPWTWDYGTGSWSYGVFRNRTDSAILSQIVKPASGSDWQIRSGEKGREQLYEKTGGSRPKIAEGWGHVQDDKQAIAFAVDRFGRQAGTYTMALAGTGQASFAFASARPATHHQLTVYEHFVGTPVAIGAATSPVSMLNPLAVFCDRDQYTRSGLPPPADAPAVKR